MAENYLSAYPCNLAYLCNYGNDLFGLHSKLIIPLVWYGFGSVRELLDLPLSLLHRYGKIMEEEGMIEKFWTSRDPFWKSKRKYGI